MNEQPKIMEDQENKDSNVFDLADRRKYPLLKVDSKDPPSGDWLSHMKNGTEFKCRDKTGRNPRWLVHDFTYLGKLKGDVYLSPTVSLANNNTWFWVDPKLFCIEWEFRGIIEEPEGD